MRPPITAGRVPRNSRFVNLSVEFCGAPAVMRAPANRNPPQARMLGRALDLCFISLSSRARPGILLRSRALRTKLFLRTATNSDETDALGCGRVSCGSSRPLFSLFPFEAAVRRCRVPFLPITATHARLSSRSHPSHGLRESFLEAGCDPSFPSLDGTPRHGLFQNVSGTFKIERQPNEQVLLTDNPLYFQARRVERFAGDLYFVQGAWITICDPQHPKWQFFAPEARIRLDKTVALVNANFRLFRVPLVWLPYATAPAGSKIRQSGLLIPEVGQSSRKGFIFGDAFYLAPLAWLDTTFGAQYMSRRGVLERGNFRARPFENTSVEYTYFGVDDRGLLTDGTRSPQGGQQQRLEIQSLLPHGWRFVTDYNHLSSLTFRLAFADTFGDAINAEVQSALFLTNNFRGFSLNLRSEER